jgi:hypothetical protein
MASRQLDRLVRIFSVLLPATGCVAEEEGIDEGAFEQQLCRDPLGVMAGLSPAEPVAYAQLREVWLHGGTGEPQDMIIELDAEGELCGDATDVAACMDAFAALPVESEIAYSGFEGDANRSVAYTRGDTAGALLSKEDIHAFLGEIDTAHDAWLLALADWHYVICDGRNNAAEVDDGWILLTQSGGGCGEGDDISNHVLHVSRAGEIEIVESELIERGDPNCAVGRLPAGLCRGARRVAGSPVGRFFADVAELEAAAVTAFGQLADELAVHRAPRALLRGALRSRRDEIRHARVTGALARRWGVRPTMPRVRPIAPRSLVEVAADNAAEGCVRETFGALVATVQARRAADPVVRRAMRSIAIDETRHAALSWELAAWAQARMSPAERRRVAAHGRDAAERFAAAVEYPEAVHRDAGMPRPDEARALFDALQRALA